MISHIDNRCSSATLAWFPFICGCCRGNRLTSSERSKEVHFGAVPTSTDTAMRHINQAFLEDLGVPVEFPTLYLPSVIERYRQNLVEQNRTPGEFLAAGICAAFSAATGNSVVGRLGTRRFIPASLYMLMIGNPGSGKSPALTHALEPIRREQTARERAARERAETPVCLTRVLPDGEVLDEGDGNETAEVVAELVPAIPPHVRYVYLTDATIPAVQYALAGNQRGLVMVADEALSLFKGSGRGGDRAIWLQIWNAENLTIARRCGKPPVVTIPRSFVTLVAGVQPDLFPRLRNPDGDDGLLDRFLLLGDGGNGWPEYSFGNIDPGIAAEYHGVIDLMVSHRDDGALNDSVCPAVLDIDEACSRRFEALHIRLTDKMKALRANQRYGGLITKLVANAQRLAVLRAAMRWTVGENGSGCSPESITLADAEAACQVAEFCFGRALLWRPELVGSERPAEAGRPQGSDAMPSGDGAKSPIELAEKIIGYMARRGFTSVPVRQLQSSGGFVPANARDLRAACQHLVDTSQGHWRDKPGREFVLMSPNQQTPNTEADGALGPAAP